MEAGTGGVKVNEDLIVSSCIFFLFLTVILVARFLEGLLSLSLLRLRKNAVK